MKNTYIIDKIYDKRSGLDKLEGFYGEIVGKKCEISGLLVGTTVVIAVPKVDKRIRTSTVCDIINFENGDLSIVTLNTTYVLKKI